MKTSNIVLYLTILALVFFNFNTEWGYMADSQWYTHLTFHFAHANIFHLAANLLVMFFLLRCQRNSDWWLWPLCYAVATAASFLIAPAKPTVGLSGILFAYYGILFLRNGPKWKPFIHTLIYMAVSCLFVSRLAVGLHFICLFIGALAGGFIGITKDMKGNNHVQTTNPQNP